MEAGPGGGRSWHTSLVAEPEREPAGRSAGGIAAVVWVLVQVVVRGFARVKVISCLPGWILK